MFEGVNIYSARENTLFPAQNQLPPHLARIQPTNPAPNAFFEHLKHKNTLFPARIYASMSPHSDCISSDAYNILISPLKQGQNFSPHQNILKLPTIPGEIRSFSQNLLKAPHVWGQNLQSEKCLFDPYLLPHL